MKRNHEYAMRIGLVLILLLILTGPGLRAQTLSSENVDSLVQVARNMEKRDLDDHTLAIQTLEHALEIAPESKTVQDSFFSETYYLLGQMQDEVGQNRLALRAYQKSYAALIARTPLNVHGLEELNQILQVLAKRHRAMPRVDDVPTYVATALTYVEAQYLETAPERQKMILLAAQLLSDIGDPKGAQAYAMRALSLAKSPRRPLPASLFPPLMALTKLHLKAGNLDSANFYLQQADLLLNKVEGSRSANYYLTKGKLLLATGHVDAAIIELRDANFLVESSENATARQKGIANIDFAQDLIRARKPNQALEQLQCALMDLVPGFTESSPKLNPGVKLWNAEPWVFEALCLKARSFVLLDDPEKAIECYAAAFDYLEELDRGFTSPESSAIVSAQLILNYESAIDLAQKTHRRTGDGKYWDYAFRFCEQSKRHDILAALHPIELGMSLQLDPRLLRQWRYHKASIARLNADAPANGKAILALIAAQKKIRATLEHQYAIIGRWLNTQVSTSAEVQRKLQPNQLLLEYYCGDSSLFIFAINGQRHACYVTARDAAFEEGITKLMRSLSLPPGKPEKSWERFAPHSRYAFQKLVGTVMAQGFANALPSSLVVVPDARMPLIPFECLLTLPEKPEEHPFLNAPYLVRQCDVRYEQSSTALVAHATRNFEQRRMGVLAFVPSPEGIDASNFAREEASQATRVIRESKMLRGNDATQKALFKMAPDYRILHFACQSRLDSNDYYHDWLALEKPDGSIDSVLSAAIYEQGLDAELVVLSAVGAPRGQVPTGDQVMRSLRPFQVAGCPTAIMSLWNIDDRASADITGRFYSQLAKSSSADHALGLARREYLKSDTVAENLPLAHPYYWATMITVGDEGPHLPLYEVNWQRWAFWGSILALIIALRQRRRRRKRQAERKRR